MSDSEVEIRKKRGRPRIGQTPVVSLRLDLDWQQDIDDWRSGAPGHPSRSDAIRILLAKGLFAANAERKRDTREEGRRQTRGHGDSGTKDGYRQLKLYAADSTAVVS